MLRQKLRKLATPAEKRLWHSLKKSQLGAKFRRQHGVGPYVLDFYCPEYKLAIEIQGGVHTEELQSEYDAERLVYLESQGIRVLYFANRTLLELPEYVLDVIRAAVVDPPPRPAGTPPGQEGRSPQHRR